MTTSCGASSCCHHRLQHHHQHYHGNNSIENNNHNKMSIEINNYAISELAKGNYKTAYEALSYAVSACNISTTHHNHHQQQQVHSSYDHDHDQFYLCHPTSSSCRTGSFVDETPTNTTTTTATSISTTTTTTNSRRLLCPYQYAWVDCTQVLQRTMAKDPKLNQGQYAPFLYMKFLLILPLDHQQQAFSAPAPCCYTWVLSYK
jgi:hypothetical protein